MKCEAGFDQKLQIRVRGINRYGTACASKRVISVKNPVAGATGSVPRSSNLVFGQSRKAGES